MKLMENIIAPVHENAKEATKRKAEARRANRTLYCMLIAFASPRRGELEKLRWEHVDLERGLIPIPKGKTKGRPVPIHDRLYPLLKMLHRGTGRVVEPWNNDKTDLKRACLRAGVPRVTPNDLRRTFATWLKQHDVDSAVVAALMGHTSTVMIDKVYERLDDVTKRRAINKIVDALPTRDCNACATHIALPAGEQGTHDTHALPKSSSDPEEDRRATRVLG